MKEEFESKVEDLWIQPPKFLCAEKLNKMIFWIVVKNVWF